MILRTPVGMRTVAAVGRTPSLISSSATAVSLSIPTTSSSSPSFSVFAQLRHLSTQHACALSNARRRLYTAAHHCRHSSLSSPASSHSSSLPSRHFHSSIVVGRVIDPYATLGLSRSASRDEVKKAYYQLAKAHHPDTNPQQTDKQKKETADKFHRIQEAYELLSDSSKRSQYERETTSSRGGRGGGVDDDFAYEAEEEEEHTDTSSAQYAYYSYGGPRPGRHRKGRWMGFEDASEFMNEVFGTWKGYGTKNHTNESNLRRQTKGADLQSDMTLSFLEAVHGCTKTILYTVDEACDPCRATGKVMGGKKKHCSHCNGKGYAVMTMPHGFKTRVECDACQGEGRLTPLCTDCKGSGVVKQQRQVEVKIPAGVNEATNVRLLHMGDAGRRGGKKGNLRIRIHVKGDEEFDRRRDGVDIHTDLHLSLPAAVLGGEHTVHTVDGAEKVRLQSGVQHGETVVIKGKGVRQVNSHKDNERGDHHVHIKVKIPQSHEMNQHQLEMMKQWIEQQHQQHNTTTEKDRAKGKGKESGAGQPEVEELNTSKSFEETKVGDKTKKKKEGKKGKAKGRRRRRTEEMENEDEDEDELFADDFDVELDHLRAEMENEAKEAYRKKKQKSRS